MTIGVLGGGQLGRMLALAGLPLGMRFRFLDPDPEAPASQIAEQVVAGYTHPGARERFVTGLETVTYEFENVPVDAAREIAARVPVLPPPRALEAAQDRLTEKTLFTELGIPVPPFRAVNTPGELSAAADALGLPLVLKTRRFGYDGKGQAVIRERGELDAAWNAVGAAPSIVETLVPFDREVSIIAVRGRDGAFAAWPLVENVHRAGILRVSRAPAKGSGSPLEEVAAGHVRRIMEHLDYVGVLTVEFFERDGGLSANEMACRVHNSGHWTIEGARTSQFENHLRAIAGLPQGDTAPIGHSVMLNLIGNVPDPAAVLAVPGAHLHLYGKSPRPGRKLGHVTLCGSDPGDLEVPLQRLRELIAASEAG